MSCTPREPRPCGKERMHRRNTGTVHTGPGDRPNRPVRLTRKKNPRENHCCKNLHRDQSTHQTSPASQDIRATRSLHNSPWCGLRSRLGVVHQQPSGSDSTRHSNHRPSDGWQVHFQLADLLQVYWPHIDLRQVHRQPADPLSRSCCRSRLAAACLRAAQAAAWTQTAAVWLRLSAAAACSSPAAAHAAPASLLRLLLLPPVLLLPLLALTPGITTMDAWTLGTAGACDRGLLHGLMQREVHPVHQLTGAPSAAALTGVSWCRSNWCTQLERKQLAMPWRPWTTYTLVPPLAGGGKCARLRVGWRQRPGPCRTWTTPS